MNSDGTMATTVLIQSKWRLSKDFSYSITGNKFKASSSKVTNEGIVTAIDDKIFQLVDFVVTTPGGSHRYDKYINIRVSNDFSKSIIGLWEGEELTGEITFGAADHRWEFKNDGTYVYYTKDAVSGSWLPDVTNSGNVYYVDGDYLSFRWVKSAVEYQEWWDIDRCDDTEMIWSALRVADDESTFETTLKMKRIK